MDKPATAATIEAANAVLLSVRRRADEPIAELAAGLPSLASSAALTRAAKPRLAVATGSERIAAPIKA